MANSQLRQSRAQLQAIFDVVPNPLAVTLAADGTLLGVSRSFAELFGLSPRDLMGRRTGPDGIGLWPSAEDRAAFLAAIEAGGGQTGGFPLDLATPEGVSHLRVSGQVLDIDGRRLLLTELHDVTGAHRDAQRLRALAERDPLTGLPNRRLLRERLERHLAVARETGTSVAVCYLDLDGLKTLNDRSGHPAGDRVLVEVGRRIADVMRDSDTAGRLGGDEFVIILGGVDSPAECARILQRVLATVAEPVVTPGFNGRVTASIGYTIFPADDGTPDQLLEHADRALYQAKRGGRNRFVRFASC